MITAIILLLAVVTFALIAGAFINALMSLNEIDSVGEEQANDIMFAAWDDGPAIGTAITVRGAG